MTKPNLTPPPYDLQEQEEIRRHTTAACDMRWLATVDELRSALAQAEADKSELQRKLDEAEAALDKASLVIRILRQGPLVMR